MSDLLSIGRSGVLAYQGALATIGENVTNADTEGYSRRQVVLKEQASRAGAYTLNRTGSGFGGVQASAVSRVWDQYKASNAWSANSDSSSAGTRAQYLSSTESLMNDSDTSGVGTRLTAIFTSAAQLSANPTDTNLRQTYLASISDAATAINITGGNLAKLSGTMATQASVTARQVNDSLGALAKVNMALRTAPDGSTARAQLEDQRDSLLGTVSGALSIDTSFATDGSVTVRLNGNQGPLLVAGNSPIASTVEVQNTSGGILSISVSDGTNVSGQQPIGGSLAGLIGAANTNAGRRDDLDALAARLIGVINDNQATGFVPAGTAGAALLDGTDAASIRLVTTDPATVAAADGTTANGNLLALANQRGANGVEETWKGMVTGQALLVSSANTEASAASTRKDGAYTTLDATTGVDLDTEAADLLRYQQAYSASAKVIQAARDTLQTILQLF